MRKLVVLLCLILPAMIPAASQDTSHDTSALTERIWQVTARPEFKHSVFGVEVFDLTANKILFAMNGDKLFTSGSTTKLVTEGTALALLGQDYRFHTRVYYTGNISEDGTLDGDLVLVGSGDPNLSGRVLPDDTLDFAARDHAYTGLLMGKAVLGDPLRVLKELASGVLMSGVGRIRGKVIVDASLFPSEVEPATHSTISPVMFNDNVIDVTATSAASVGGPVAVEVSPALPYLKVINKVKTGKPDSELELQFTSDATEADGSHTVVLEGNIPAGRETAQAAYKVRDPALFATQGFCAALRWAGILLEAPVAEGAEGTTPAANARRTLLTEHVSPPFKEEVKLTLKVSQNLHAATTPYLLGAILGNGSADAFQKGLGLERRFLTKAGLEPESVSQLDGEGGMGSAFSPDFMVRYLAYISRQPYGRLFYDSLAVLGRDGTLMETMPGSPASGHVHAKTGSYVVSNALTGGVMVLGKGLAGYVDAANGHRLIFAAFVNMVPLRDMDDVSKVGGMLAEIAGLAYQYAPPAAGPAPKTAIKKKPAHK